MQNPVAADEHREAAFGDEVDAKPAIACFQAYRVSRIATATPPNAASLCSTAATRIELRAAKPARN